MKYVSCNLCHKHNTKFLFKVKDRLHKVNNNEFNLVKCMNCGLVYLNPQPQHEELVKYYPDDYGPYSTDSMDMFKIGPIGNFVKKIRDSLFWKDKSKSKDLDKSNKNYFDFGCGGGDSLVAIREAHPFWNIEGSDINTHACEKARSRGFKIYTGRINELKLQKDFYDIININHVIEHLNDPLHTVESLVEFLSPGGELIISTPNFDSFAAKIFRSYWYATDAPRHLYLFSTQTLSELLKKTGLIVNEINYNTGPKVAIKSVYHLIGRRDMRINHFLWRMFEPFSKIASLWDANSIMTIKATKNNLL